MTRAGAHAGRLHPEEQFVFAMVFALMAGFVVVITMSAVRSSVNTLLAGGAAAASSQTIPAGSGGTTDESGPAGAGGAAIQAASPRLDASLAAALAPVRGAHPGQLAVGVIDETTGRQALYAANERFSSGDIVAADIVAALVIRDEQAGSPVTTEQAALVTAMMAGSTPATTTLWRDIGAGNGLASANRVLKLRQTIPGSGDQWEQTRTTVSDQLQLLTDVISSRSPLTVADRDYLVRVLGGGSAAQARSGAAAAADGAMVQGSWAQQGTLWLTNSLAVVTNAGHVLLVVVLSSGSTSQAAGASLASAVAAAAGVMAHAGH